MAFANKVLERIAQLSSHHLRLPGLEQVDFCPYQCMSKCMALQARAQQLARLTREENLGRLQVELANQKRLRLNDMRSFSRIVRPAWSDCHLSSLLYHPWDEET